MASASRPRAVRRDDAERPAAASVEAGRSMVDLEFVRGLIEAVDNSSIDSLELNRAGTRIRISKTPPAAAVISAAPAFSAPAHASAPAQPPAQVQAQAPAPAPAAVAAASNLADIKSPMVGTFYRQPAPEAPPYVEIGSTVKKGQTLCILEAMKLMNELESEVDGVIREILVENSDPVEYGQVLFRIEPA
jgi:acetyl-CoA carboxylase biotin carboxyl carrier protein